MQYFIIVTFKDGYEDVTGYYDLAKACEAWDRLILTEKTLGWKVRSEGF